MRRRTFLASAAVAARPAPSSPPSSPPGSIDYRDYSRVLPNYLTRLASEAYQRRKRTLAAIATPSAAQQRCVWARETFWKLIGGPLEKTPLNARTTASLDRSSYRIEKLIYESRPGLHIPANLYIPKSGKPPYPGVLFQMGHSLNGKAAAIYQYCCQGLAQLGFLVLAFDPMGQGERTYYPKFGANLTRLPSADDEHTVPGKQLLLTGDTATRFQVWDAIRSLDFLASHPLVDPTRLASTGNSGGGTITMFLAAADDRLACAAPACPNTENLACANFNPPGSTDDAEQDFLFSAPAGFDRWDTLYPFAPKPLLIIVSAKDSQGTYSPRYLENGREEFAALGRFYNTLGKPQNLAWHETPLPHGLSYDVRMEIYRWFRRHLQSNEQPLDQEPPVQAEKDEVLYASPTGNVVRDFAGLTPHKIALANSASIRTPERAALESVSRLLSLDSPVARLTVKGATRIRTIKVEAIEVESAGGVFLPAWLFHPEASKQNGRLIVLADSRGRNVNWNEDSLCQQWAEAGSAVCACDVRGIGDLRPEFPRHAPGHGRSHQEEEAFAWSSLMLGKPLLGQRVTDLLAFVRALGSGRKVTLAASGSLTVPALFAAVLEKSVEELQVRGGLHSYRSLLEQEQPSEPFANYLWDVLRITDLPQLRALVKWRSL